MKKMKFLAMALAALTIVSCSKENNGGGVTPPVPEGIETYATFSFSVEGAGKTKADSETDEDKTETATPDAVNNIIVTVFKEGTPAVLEATETFTAEVGSTILIGKPMKLTSGPKRIFVFANAKSLAGFPALTVGTTTLEDCYDSKMVFNPFTLASISKVDGYFMSNARTASSVKTLVPNISSDASKDATGDDTAKEQLNNFTFSVQKGVSKVTAKHSDGVTNIPANATTKKGTISNLNFTVRNINTALRPVQLFASADITDADAGLGENPTLLQKAVLPQAPYYTDFNLTSDVDMKKLATFEGKYDRSYSIDQLLSKTAAVNSVLITENTNAKQVNGNTTYLAVSGKYRPSEVLASCTYDKGLNDGTFAPVVGVLDGSGDFWKVRIDDLKHLGNTDVAKLKNNLFSEEDGAKDLLTLVLEANEYTGAELDAQVAARLLKYTGGMSYYRLNIGITVRPEDETTGGKTTFGIKRNSVYDIEITKINKLGGNTEEGLDEEPETPVTSEETFVTATIKVKPWVTMPQFGEL